MSETPYGNLDIFGLVESFDLWINDVDNQTWFCSAQEAYHQWLTRVGFSSIGDNYTAAVTVILVFLSRCIASPINRRYLISSIDGPDEFAILQVNGQEAGSDQTFWEFLTEANFHEMYADWQ
jgi:hypothetical protein